MSNVRLWRCADNITTELTEEQASERDLEDLLEANPAILEPGLRIVHRQLKLEAGRLDLLAIGPTGTVKVIEIKRGEISSDVIGQSLHYKAALEAMKFDKLQAAIDEYLSRRGGKQTLRDLLPAERFKEIHTECQVEVMLVGTRKTPGIEQVIERTLKNPEAYSVLLLQLHKSTDGSRVIVREDYPVPATSNSARGSSAPRPAKQLDELVAAAKQNGIGGEFERFVKMGQECGLYPRCWGGSLMYTPQDHRTRMVFTAWVKPVNGRLSVYVSPEAVGEFGAVSSEAAESEIGKAGYRELDLQQLDALAAKYRTWFPKSEST
jgi:Holliday junction resolvase-like predicted endonuclease